MSGEKNLCEACIYEPNSCEGDPNDCDAFVASELEEGLNSERLTLAKEPDSAQASPEPKIEASEQEREYNYISAQMMANRELCGSCGEPLKVSKVNRRVRALLCDNVRCKLYRESIRTYSIPKSIPEPIIPETMYYCEECRVLHHLTSKIGKKHLKGGQEDADNTKVKQGRQDWRK